MRGRSRTLLTHYLNLWLPAAGVALLFFAYFVEGAIDHLQARHGPQTTGKIVESAVEGNTQDGVSFGPRICFTYHAAGLPRESRQFAFHCWLGSRAQAEA